MSFQGKLDKELERRNLKDTESDAAPAPSTKNFSFKYFLFGLLLAVFVTVSFSVYAAFNRKQTALTLQEKLSTKAALVERETILPTMTVQPVVTMLPKDTPPSKAATIQSPDTASVNTRASKTTGIIIDVIPDLYESTALGLKPIKREKDGLTVFEAYKNGVNVSDKPKLAFVVFDVGLSSKKTKQLIKDLPDNISMAFSPYSSNLPQLSKSARKDGHEIWMTLPLQSTNFPLDDPGPLTLLKEVSTVQNKDRLDKLLTLTTGYVGFIPAPTHNYTPEAVRTSPVVNEMLDRGLAIIESRIGSRNFIKELAVAKNTPFGQTDFWLNPEESENELKQEMQNAVRFAKARGSALIMFYPYPSSIKAVKNFIASSSNEFELAPASALVSYGG